MYYDGTNTLRSRNGLLMAYNASMILIQALTIIPRDVQIVFINQELSQHIKTLS